MSRERTVCSGLRRFVDEPSVSNSVWDPCINTESDVVHDHTGTIWGLVPQYRNGTNLFVSRERTVFSELRRFVDEPSVSNSVWDPCINTESDVVHDHTGTIWGLVPQYRNGTNLFVPRERTVCSGLFWGKLELHVSNTLWLPWWKRHCHSRELHTSPIWGLVYDHETAAVPSKAGVSSV